MKNASTCLGQTKSGRGSHLKQGLDVVSFGEDQSTHNRRQRIPWAGTWLLGDLILERRMH